MRPVRHALGWLAGEIGATDCERLDHHELVSQPVNAVSSLTYVVAGAWVVRWATREPRVPTPDAAVFAILLGVVGLGSVDFHGPQTPIARFVHDASVVILLAWMASFDLRLVVGWSRARGNVVVAAVAILVAIALVVEPDAGIAITAIVGAAFAVAELTSFRRKIRRWHEPDGFDRVRPYVVAGVLAGLALVVNVAGRTDAPLCDPDSWYQGHGAWHALSAIAFAAWARGALAVSTRDRTIPS